MEDRVQIATRVLVAWFNRADFHLHAPGQDDHQAIIDKAFSWADGLLDTAKRDKATPRKKRARS